MQSRFRFNSISVKDLTIFEKTARAHFVKNVKRAGETEIQKAATSNAPATPSRSRQRVRLGDAGDAFSGQRFLSDADGYSAQAQNDPAAS